MTRICGLVIAAGESTRMGGFPKPLLYIGGLTFVEKICSVQQQANVPDTVVIVGYEHEEVTKRVELAEADIVVNRAYQRGMLSSIQTGVRHIDERDFDALLLWPVDYPVVTAHIVQRLVGTFNDEPSSDIVVPTVQGERGHPALFAASTYDPLLNAPHDQGAKAVVYADDTQVTEVEVDDQRIHVDIDTPAEYWTAVKQYTDR